MPSGDAINDEWRRDLGVALTAAEAAETPAVMACEFQIILVDAAIMRSMMHLSCASLHTTLLSQGLL